jgi:hypothetical protein
MNRSRGASVSHPKRGSTETRRRVMRTVETEKETSRCSATPLSSGSDQEGRVKRVKLGRRMRRSVEIQARHFGIRHGPRRFKNIDRNHHRRMECHVSDGQYAGGLRRSHPLAAIVTLIGRVAGHGATALHALLVLRHRGHAVRKLQTQQGDHGYNNE